MAIQAGQKNWSKPQRKEIFVIFNDCKDMCQNLDEIVSLPLPVNRVFKLRLENTEIGYILQPFFKYNLIARLKICLKVVLNCTGNACESGFELHMQHKKIVGNNPTYYTRKKWVNEDAITLEINEIALYWKHRVLGTLLCIKIIADNLRQIRVFLACPQFKKIQKIKASFVFSSFFNALTYLDRICKPPQ